MTTNSSNPYERRVKHVMTTQLVSVGADDTIHDALSLFVENKVSALPVVNRQNRCVGILSTTDVIDLTHGLLEELSDPARVGEVLQEWLVDRLTGKDTGHRKVSELMTHSVATVTPELPLVDAARAMVRNQVHRLPVLDGDQRPVGIISTMDIVNAFAEGGGD